MVETTEHKCLQSQFSVLYNEAMQLKTQLEDARNQLQVTHAVSHIKKTHIQNYPILPCLIYQTEDWKIGMHQFPTFCQPRIEPSFF